MTALIDTHQHLVYPEAAGYAWTDGIPPLAKQSFTVERYQELSKHADIAGTIFMETGVDDADYPAESRFVNTLAENFQEISQVKILIEGDEAGDIGGHFVEVEQPVVLGSERYAVALSSGKNVRYMVCGVSRLGDDSHIARIHYRHAHLCDGVFRAHGADDLVVGEINAPPPLVEVLDRLGKLRSRNIATVAVVVRVAGVADGAAEFFDYRIGRGIVWVADAQCYHVNALGAGGGYLAAEVRKEVRRKLGESLGEFNVHRF